MSVMADTSKPIDRYIPWMIAAFFLSFMTVDGIMAYLAIKTHSGLVTEQAYEKGLNYNQSIEALEAQEKLGWTSEISFNGTELEFVLKDKSGQGLDQAIVKAEFVRAVTSGHDFTLNLQDHGNGRYSAPVNFPLTGLWTVRIISECQGQPYQSSKELVVK